MKTVWESLRRKGIHHWVIALALTVVGVIVGHYVSESDLWIDLRYMAYQKTMDATRVRGPLYPKRTVLVLVGDGQYWKGELGARVPIKRDILAKVLEKLASADPAAIAIDFDLRSPAPDGKPLEHPDYEQETAVLRSAIARIATKTPLILPASVGLDDSGDYFRVSSILDVPRPAGSLIREGYLQLPYDKRRVPLQIELGNGQWLDSFSQAIVRTVDSVAYNRAANAHEDSLPFISYMTEADFGAARAGQERIIDSTRVMSSDSEQLRQLITHNVVIISGCWSTLAYGTGPRIDMHATPAGRQPGALVHANFVEAILNERTYKGFPEFVAISVEVLVVAFIAVVFALEISAWWKAGTAIAASLLLALVCFVGLQNLGLFFDFFVPLIVLSAHVAIDKVMEWRKHAAQSERQHAHAAQAG